MLPEQTSLSFDFPLQAEETRPELVVPVRPLHPATEEKKPEPVEEPVKKEISETVNEVALPSRSKRGRKSLKDLELTSQFVKVPEDEILFQRHYYSITEVAEMFSVNPSLLRFWESEFPVQLRLRKNKKGDRFFTPQDIKTVEQLWFLLREKKLTIEGARDHFKKSKKGDEKFKLIQSLQQLKTFLMEMKASL